jgi:hypothetical protein
LPADQSDSTVAAKGRLFEFALTLCQMQTAVL